MPDQSTLNLEATKLVKEWSVWMVAVQSGLTDFLATTSAPQSPGFVIAINFALGSFAISLLAAAWVLSALPYVLIRLLEQKDPNSFFMRLSSGSMLNLIPL